MHTLSEMFFRLAFVCLLSLSFIQPTTAQIIDPGDSAILRVFYDSLDGPSWTPITWDTNAPAHTWPGITVDGNGRVTEILFGSLTGNGLRGVVPDAINGLTELQNLTLIGNQVDTMEITDLPPNLNGLSKLETLRLSAQELTTLPSLDPLVNLTTLILDRNHLTSLPSLDALTSLKWMTVFANDLSTLPPLDSLRNLIEFNCSSNDLVQLPAFTDSLYRLQRLICAGCNLTSLPSFEHLTGLTVLQCYDNNLTSLPDFPNPAGLGYLNARINSLTSLPDLALFPNLTGLEVDINQLDTLIHLDSLRRLTRLNISRNPLNYTPPFHQLDSLTFLGVGEIGMDTLPPLDALVRLVDFGCNGNNLSSFPSLEHNVLLETLNAHENELESFPYIGHLQNLEILSIYSNQLYEVPGLDSLTGLRILHLDDNLFSDLPDFSAFQSLTSLWVTLNYLDTLKGISEVNQPLLEDLFVTGNQLDDLPFLPSVDDIRAASNHFDLDDLLPYSGVFLGPTRYAGQGPIPMLRDTILGQGGTDSLLVFRPQAGGDELNVYSWTKDGLPIAGVDSLIIQLPTDSGSYVCTVTHPDLPGLTLTTGPINPCVDFNLCDMNLDGVCDIRDLEPLAAQLYAMGTSRECGETPLDWGVSYQGIDLKFLDCTGDGMLTKDDTLCLRQYYDAMSVAKFLESSIGVGLDAAYEDSTFSEQDTLLSTGHRVRFTETVENVVGVVFVREIIPPEGYTARDAYHELDASDFAIRDMDDSVNTDSMIVFTQFFPADSAVRSPEINSPNARIEVGIFRTNGNGKTMSPSETITICKVLVEEPPQKRATTELPMTFISYVMVYQADGTVVPMTEHPDTTTLVFYDTVPPPDTSSSILISLEEIAVKLYPNPLREGQLLQVEHLPLGQVARLQFHSLTGQLLWEHQLPPHSETATITLPKLERGMVLVRIQVGNRARWEKLILQE